MSSVDSRIVQMQFENSQFEKGIRESLKSIDDLEKKLEFKDAEKSLAALQKAGDSFSLASMADGIEKIGEKFSVLGIIGKRVLEDLTDSAVRMGEQFIKSVTVDQVSAGWDKYANKTQAVQTIMAATGKDIEFIDAQLERLAWFTDETSYDFVAMTNNIGKFTSMGVDLETSVTAMEGIATWAAVSGANAQEASRAMYNMSQALGVGSVKLMDWKSIENANMATKEFKQTAIETAKAMGKLNAQGKTAKGTAVTYENFAQTLSEGWFTKDVLISTLQKYGEYADAVYSVATEKGISAAQAMELVSGNTMELGEKAFKAAQEAKTYAEAINAVKDAVSSGWMNIFENIFGNYEEAKELWTDLANYLWDMFAAPLSSTNELLAKWKEAGGRAELFQGIYDIFEGIANIVATVGDAIDAVFPKLTSQNLVDMSRAVADFGKQFKQTFGRYETEIRKPIKKESELDKQIRLVNEGYGEERTAAIRAVQAELEKLGYLSEKDYVSGTWGPSSDKALENFQNGVKKTEETLKTSLKFGDKGEEVKEFQQQLKDLNFDPGAVDGIWGPKTQQAYDNYIASLGRTFTEYKELKKGMRDEDVRTLQFELIQAGYLDAGQADGIFGPKTENALKEWQKAHDIVESGIFDKDTYDSMYGEQAKRTGKSIEYETETVIDYSDKMKNLLYITRGAASALHILTSFFGFLGKVVGHIGSLFSPLIDAFIAIAAALGNSLTSFDKWLQEAGVFDKWFEDVKKFLQPFGDWIQKAADGLLAFFGISKNAKDSNSELMTFAKLWNNIKESVKKTGIIDKVTASWNKFKASLDKIKGSLDKTSKTFKENLGKKFTEFLTNLPVKIASVVEWLGNLVTDGLDLISPWIEKIPGAIDKIKGFWAALTQKGDSSKNQAPGFLVRVKDAFKSVIDFLFGEGDIANGKSPGVFRRLGRLIMGDLEGFTEGFDENTKKKVLDAIQGIQDFIEQVREAVVVLFGGSLGEDKKLSDDTVEKIENFKTSLKNIVDAIKLLFTGETAEGSTLPEETVNWITNFRDTITGIIQKIKDAFATIKETIESVFTSENGLDLSSIEGFKTSLSEWFDNIIGMISDPAQKVGNSIKSIGKTALLIVLALILGAIRLVINSIQTIKELITGETDNETIKQIRSTVIGVFNSVKSFVTDVISAINGLVTGNTDDEKILNARNTIIGIIESISGFVMSVYQWVKDFITGNTDNEDVLNARNTVIGIFNAVKEFVTDVFGMVVSFATGSTDDERVNNLRETLGGFFESVGAFFISIFNTVSALITGKTDNETILGIRDTIIGIFNAIGDMVTKIYNAAVSLFSGEISFESISKFFTDLWANIKEFLTTIAGIIGEKIGVGAEDLSKFFDELWKNLKSLLKWALIAIVAIKVIRFIGNLGGLFTKLGDALDAFRGKSQSIGKSILMAAIGIGIIAAAIWFLSTIDPETLKRGLDAMGEIFKALLVFMTGSIVSSLLKSGKELESIGKAVLSLGIGIGIITAAVWLLGSQVSDDSYKKGIDRVIQIVGLIAGLFVAIGLVNRFLGPISTTLEGFWQIALLVGVMALVAWKLGGLDDDTLKRGMIALLEIMGMVAGLLVVIGITNKFFGSISTSLKGLWSLAILIGVMAFVVAGLGKLNDEQLKRGITGLVTIMASLAAVLLILGLLGKNLKIGPTLAFFVGLTLVVVAMGVILYLLRDMDWTVIAAFSAGLTTLIAAVTLALPALGSIPISTILKGCLGLIVIFTALGLAVKIVLGLIGSSLSDFSGALWLVSNDLKDFSDTMAKLDETGLNNFKNFVNTICDCFKLVVSVDTTAVANFSAALLKIGAGVSLYLLETAGLTATTGDDFKNFADKVYKGCSLLYGLVPIADGINDALLAIGGAIKLFYGDLQGATVDESGKVSTEVVQGAFDAIAELDIDETAIANVAKYADGQGSGLNDFATGLTNLSTAIRQYGEDIGSLNMFKVMLANTVLGKVSDVATAMTGVYQFDGLMGKITGVKNSFTQFILDVEALGTALGSYGTNIGTLDSTQVETANGILTTISNLDIKTKGGFIGWITGQTSLDKFAANIKHIGDGLKSYADSISGTTFDKETIENSLIPLTTLADVMNNMKATGGLKGLISGDTSLNSLSTSIATFGQKIAEFKTNLGDIKYKDVEDGMAIIEKAIELQGAYAVALDNTGWGTYTGGIGVVGSDLYDFFTQLSGIKSDGYYGVGIAVIQGAKQDLTELFEACALMNDYDPNIGLGKFNELLVGLEDGINNIKMNAIPEYNQTGLDLADAIATGFSGLDMSFAASFANEMANSLKKNTSSFVVAGKNFVAGLMTGALLKSQSAVQLAYNIGRAMVNAVAKAFRSASPSKETMKLGNYFTEGLAIGTEDRIGEATNSVENVANSMLNTASGTLATLSGLLSEDIDDTPVIAPVVDLSNARASAAIIGGLFGNQSFGVTSNYMANQALVSTNNGRPVTIQNGTINTSEAMASVNEKLNALNAALNNRNDGPHVDPMETLGEKFGELANAVTNLKVVLDSGTLVGEISGMMDTDLGDLAMKRDRGN